MVVKFENFEFSFLLKGKPVFKPTERGTRIGYDVKRRVEAAVQFEPFVYHLREGGHVAALHAHRQHAFFARADIERFFYGIGRNRVAHTLASVGVERPGHYARWSTVRNPYEDPRYALPYGFVQSPILATLVLMRSEVGAFLRELPTNITPSVYMDDISLSSDDAEILEAAFVALCETLRSSNFAINVNKVRTPRAVMDLFNCDLNCGRTTVREDRRAEFHAVPHTGASEAAFMRYCESVERGNA